MTLEKKRLHERVNVTLRQKKRARMEGGGDSAAATESLRKKKEKWQKRKMGRAVAAADGEATGTSIQENLNEEEAEDDQGTPDKSQTNIPANGEDGDVEVKVVPEAGG